MWGPGEKNWVLEEHRKSKEAGKKIDTKYFQWLWEEGVILGILSETRNPDSLRTLIRGMEGQQ
eukprot:766148-Amphidinium_carterae.1